jgi:hypothetical protein
MKHALLTALLAVLCASAAHADGAAGGVTPTVRAGGVAVRLKDLVLTPRPGGKVFVLWDAFNYREILASKGAGALTATAQGLAKSYGLKNYPKSKTVHVSVVEYQERDSYDTPRYDSMRELGQFDFQVDPSSRKLTLAAPTPEPAN